MELQIFLKKLVKTYFCSCAYFKSKCKFIYFFLLWPVKSLLKKLLNSFIIKSFPRWRVCTLLTCWTNILSIEVLQRSTVAKNVKFCPEIMIHFCLLQEWKSYPTIARIPKFFQRKFLPYILVLLLNFFTRKKSKYWKSNKILREISKILYKSKPEKGKKVNFWHGFPLNLRDCWQGKLTFIGLCLEWKNKGH